MPARRLDPAAPGAIEAALGALRHGELVVYPTETLYGLGGDARQPTVFARIAAAKGRAPDRPFPLLLPDDHDPGRYALAPPETEQLARRFWPGGLTLVLPARPEVPALWSAATGWLGLRRSADPVARALVNGLGAPLVATSANVSGGAEPVSLVGLDPAIVAAAAVILDAGPRPLGRPSTVVRCEGGRWTFLRVGAVSAESVCAALAGPDACS